MRGFPRGSRRWPVKPGELRLCQGCGLEFQRTGTNHLYCSRTCRDSSCYADGGRERQRVRVLDRWYNLTPELVRALEIQQQGLCAMCGNRPNKRGLFVDHNHQTGAVRGLLCSVCNLSLGHYEKKRLIIETYLQAY